MAEYLYKKELEGIVCFSDDLHPYACDIDTCLHQEAHELYKQWINSLQDKKRPYRRKKRIMTDADSGAATGQIGKMPSGRLVTDTS